MLTVGYSQSRWILSNQPFLESCWQEFSPETVPAGGSHSQPMGHFSLELWNSGIVPVKLYNGREP